MKWWWRFGDEREALWRKVIADKYGADNSGWWPNLSHRTRRSSLWGAIASVGDVSSKWGKVLSKGVGFVEGEGREVRF